MSKTHSRIKGAYKPFDVVEAECGSVGIITEVSVQRDIDGKIYDVEYAVDFIVKKSDRLKHAWWDRKELKKHNNLMLVVAKAMCHPAGRSYNDYDALMGAGIAESCNDEPRWYKEARQ